MDIVREVIVFDAPDLTAESRFWAGILGGSVIPDDADGWHSVLDGEGRWRMGIQYAPDHVAPTWPDPDVGQQVHLDLHVDDPAAAHEQVLALGARLLQAASDPDGAEGFQVYASPAGHPFCIGWGQPPAGARFGPGR